MKEIKQLLLRAKNIPHFKIVEKEIDNNLKVMKEFNQDVLMPYIKTGARLFENIIELPVWDDEEVLKLIIPPWGFHKFCTYSLKEFGLGQVHIKLKIGKKYKKNNDYRFREEHDVTFIDYYFLFDFNLRHYVQVNPNNSDEWQGRFSQMALIEKQTFSVVWNYIINLKPSFLKKHEIFQKNNSKTYSEINNHFEIINDFLNDTWFYIDLLYIIYGDINQDEHNHIEQAIRRYLQLISTAKNYIAQFDENEKFDAHLDYKNRQTEDSVFGIITETLFLIDNFIKERKEKIDDDGWFAYNPLQGYLKGSKKENKIFPNIAEVERRRSLYKQAANPESENGIINEIIRRLK